MKDLKIAWQRMHNSGLMEASRVAPEEVVGRHGAMQAQDYGPAKWSIGQRAGKLLDDDLDRALAEGSIVRTHVLRPTWHFVASDDVRWLLALTGPRVHQHNRSRYRELGLDHGTLAGCEKLIGAALEGGNRLTRNDIAGILDRSGIDRAGQRLAHILMHCELEATICSGGLNGKQQTYALLDERVPIQSRFDRDEALVELVRRYLTSHGPATVRDLRWWSSLVVEDIKKGLHMLGSEVQSEVIDGMTFWSIASEVDGPPSGRGVHLLQAYDELIVGYSESRYFGDPRAAAARAAWKDRSLPNGVVLLNGGVAGHWRRSVEKDGIRIEVLLYDHPTSANTHALQGATQALAGFVGCKVTLELSRRRASPPADR